MKGGVLTGVGLALVLCTGAARAAYVVDGDGDGISDEVDQCLYSPRGVTVGANGCSRPGDEDEDGVPESVDACPQTPVRARVDRNGCALDADVDGVADGVDRCPDTALGVVVTANGCRKGEKPRVAAATKSAPPPRTTATPPTSLPSAAIPASPSVTRPPPPASPIAQAPPVPESSAARSPGKLSVVPVQPGSGASQDGALYLSIQFAPGQAELSNEWRQLLAGQVASLGAVLNQRPGTVLMVVGHADAASDGKTADALAGRRAGVVREALAAMSVPAARLNARTQGARDPQYKGADAARNRRVDLLFLDTAAPIAATAAPAAARPVAPPAGAPTSASAKPASVPRATPAASKPPAATAPVARPADLSIRFGAHSAELDITSTRALDAFADACVTPLRVDAASRIVVAGGAAAEESGPAAAELAKARATAIRTYLVSIGLPRDRVMMDAVAGASAGVKLRAL